MLYSGFQSSGHPHLQPTAQLLSRSGADGAVACGLSGQERSWMSRRERIGRYRRG